MIRYAISLPQLRRRIEDHKPGWSARAADRTERFRALGKFDESSHIWSEIKAVFMCLQGQKCAFCERKLESEEHGLGEQDVEHFRPKGRVTRWELPDGLANLGIAPVDIPAGRTGYHLLPYHPFNLCSACKPCNSALKSDRFPVEAGYHFGQDDPRDLFRGEHPYLIYPIGSVDDDPESLIEFQGLSPRARRRRGRGRRRAMATIAFFDLDDAIARKNLFRERAMIILVLYERLVRVVNPATLPVERERAEAIIDKVTVDTSPHANCARSFKRLFHAEPERARAIFDQAETLILSGS